MVPKAKDAFKKEKKTHLNWKALYCIRGNRLIFIMAAGTLKLSRDIFMMSLHIWLVSLWLESYVTWKAVSFYIVTEKEKQEKWITVSLQLRDTKRTLSVREYVKFVTGWQMEEECCPDVLGYCMVCPKGAKSWLNRALLQTVLNCPSVKLITVLLLSNMP